MFPNQFNVYLHDTPADSLFARAAARSATAASGSRIRWRWREYVLRDQPEWTQARIEEAMHAGEEKTVKLKSAIPVYLGYWTARVRADGIAQFRRTSTRSTGG